MKGFKQCEKGHFYKEELEFCNYCPKPGAIQSGAGEKTQIFGSQTNAVADGDKTVVVGGAGTQTNLTENASSKKDLGKTFIQGISEPDVKNDPTGAAPTRRIVGWIISYTLDRMGLDYRIYEGNNTIGRDVSNSIIILKDHGVSGRHVTLLCKNGKFYLKDEMASNGTFINNEELEIGKPYDLKDGDEIRLGATTTFKFKSAL